MITKLDKTYSTYSSLVSMMIRCIEGYCNVDSEIVYQCYCEKVSEIVAIEKLYEFSTFSSCLRAARATDTGSVFNEQLIGKPWLRLSESRFTDLTRCNHVKFVTLGGTIVTLKTKMLGNDIQYGIVPVTMSELGNSSCMKVPETNISVQMSRASHQTSLTGQQFLRILKKNRIPLSCFALKINTTVERLQSLKDEKTVPNYFLAQLQDHYQLSTQ